MLDIIKKSLEVGLGAITVTQEKLKEITDELVVKGNLTQKEGGDILKELIKVAEEGQKKIKNLVEEQVHKAIKETGIATNADIKALEGKIAKVEAQLAKKSAKKESKKK